MDNESPARRIDVTLSVASHEQAEELQAAWQEIVTGRTMPRAQALEQDTATIIDRAQEALAKIEKAIYSHPTSGQARRLVQFLAAIYNGSDYDFDLTDLRTLDTELANACLDYLNYDRLGKREVHSHLKAGDRDLHGWIRDYAIPPHLSLDESQAEDFAALCESADRSPNQLLREAISLLLAKKRATAGPTAR